MNAPATSWPSSAACRWARSLLERLEVLVADRAAADRAQVVRAARRRRPGGRGTRGRRRGRPAWRAGTSPSSKPRQAVADVGGVADLAHLAVADTMSTPGLDLSARRDPRPRRAMTRSYSAGSTGSPLSSANTTSTTSCGRGRLPDVRGENALAHRSPVWCLGRSARRLVPNRADPTRTSTTSPAGST